MKRDSGAETNGAARGDPGRAAQYVRMSTEHQKYSTENQADAIRQYAERRGFAVVRTYADEGKSGLSLDGRDALKGLIDDVQNGNADFTTILVYDVSRWGRFQDADESAYYEYICKRAGITVQYCAEQFENDGSPVSTIVKGVKRAMAGEYSRELSAKVFAGQCRLIDLGFRQGGPAGYGLRRMRVDVVVAYKIDRLSRSLMDFAKLVEVFDRRNVTFVSVTQSFNTTTSMGRLTLNVLLSFAQFEREVIGERIRDKIAASRRKGMWMGGYPVLGYEVKDRKLVVNEAEAATVRRIFERFVRGESITALARTLSAEGMKTKQGSPVDKGFLYRLLRNRTYLGEAVCKGVAYPGEHAAIVNQGLWDKVQAILRESPRRRAARTRAQTPALLKGLIFGPTGSAMTPTHTRRRGKLYQYYVSNKVLKHGADACPIRRVPAGEIENAVIHQIRALLRSPEIVVRTWRAARGTADITEAEVCEALERFDPMWEELFPAEQARIVQLLVERVDVGLDAVEIRLRIEGLASLLADLRGAGIELRRVA